MNVITKTHEILTTKVCLLKINDNGKTRKDQVVGYEYEPPTEGAPYVVYIGKGNVFRTSAVKGAKVINDSIMVKTSNSLYRLKYMH